MVSRSHIYDTQNYSLLLVWWQTHAGVGCQVNMIELLKNEDQRTKMSQSARIVAQDYSWSEIAKAIETIYNRISPNDIY